MIQIINKDACCGCTACASICTHKAITMQSDELGFFYPKVDKEICVLIVICVRKYVLLTSIMILVVILRSH